MTLAMANALFFSSPFFVSILAVIFLKEKVGIRRWLGIAVGFLGCVYSFWILILKILII
jgi:drug/metabolite transporter (DMT)-like permease